MITTLPTTLANVNCTVRTAIAPAIHDLAPRRERHPSIAQRGVEIHNVSPPRSGTEEPYWQMIRTIDAALPLRELPSTK